MKRPLATLNPQQRMLADLLALGYSIESAAKALGMKETHVKVLLKGSLFTLEIDRAREKIMKERREQFNKALADEFEHNVEELKRIRDHSEKDSDRLHAIDTMLGYAAIPASKRGSGDSGTVKVVISGDKRNEVEAILTEATNVTPANDD